MKLQQKLAMGLCAFYLISIIGVAVNMHFCGGKLSSLHFTETIKCSGCKKPEKEIKGSSSCCKNTVVEAKIKDSHEASSKISIPQNYGIELFSGTYLTHLFDNARSATTYQIENKAPPLSAVLSLHIYNCVFRN